MRHGGSRPVDTPNLPQLKQGVFSWRRRVVVSRQERFNYTTITGRRGGGRRQPMGSTHL